MNKHSDRLFTYVTLAAGTTVAGSSAMAGVVIVDITSQNVLSGLTINLWAAADGVSFAQDFMFGPTQSFGGLNGVDPGKLTGSQLVGYGELLDSSDNWAVNDSFRKLPVLNTTRYLGFRLNVGADYRFGWIEFVNAGGSITVSRWAYESDVNTGITAGASGGVVPGLGGLAALACGAAGMRRSRNRVA